MTRLAKTSCGKASLQQLVAADAGAAIRQEADVVVLGLAFPARGGEADGKGHGNPQAHDLPGMIDRNAAEQIEHASLCTRAVLDLQ